MRKDTKTQDGQSLSQRQGEAAAFFLETQEEPADEPQAKMLALCPIR